MPCFTLPDGLVVITHGFIKKRDRISPGEIQRAAGIEAEDESVFAREGEQAAKRRK